MPERRKARAVGFNHVALEVGDIDEALAFYGKLFTFELRGRLDRVAKIGGKRISLPDIEADLCGHRFVREAAVCAIAPQAASGAARLHAVVTLTAAGREVLARDGRKAIAGALGEWLVD